MFAMGSSRALVCSTAFVLVLLSSASADERLMEQREVTFDLDKIMQELQVPDQHIMQEEVLDLVEPKGPPVFGPRSYGPPSKDYPVQFPLGRPTLDNLNAICHDGDHRPRYPNSYFPASGFSKLKRMASAVNAAESWFTACCQGNETWGREVTLCCATQAWELSVASFCEEDSSVKDRLYECCRQRGSDRLSCFHNDAPNPNYAPTELFPVELLRMTDGFSFNPATCQRSVMTPYSVTEKRRKPVKKPSDATVDISFPPERPTADATESLCNNQKLRPLYSVKCLPGQGFEWLARQAKTVNRIEKGFKQCCKKKKNVFSCADQKWREELDRFCVGHHGEPGEFKCCAAADGTDDRYNCFQTSSSKSHYNMTSTAEELSLSKICDTHKIIKKKFPVGFPLKSFTIQCCPLPEQDRTMCFEQRLKETSEKLCSSRKAATPAIRRCCRVSAQEPPQCISKILMDAVTKATNVSKQKKKKKCPLS
ncbi:uncharacterized protein V6R79_004716 [Siganus canaliculatus]